MKFVEQIKNSADKACCWDAAPDGDKRQQTWRIRDGGVGNVIVFLEPPAGKSFPKMQFKGAIVVDQPICQYVPRVAVVRPGESITFRNSSTVHHSVAFAGIAGVAMARDKEMTVHLKPAKRPLEITCSVHAWMNGYIWPTDNPYTTVTNDRGAFEIRDAPTGVNLGVLIWHEAHPRFIRAATITTKEGENTLEIKIKPS